MKLRLHGSPADCQAAAAALRCTPGLHVQDQSPPYPDRTGELVRVYLTVHLDLHRQPHPCRRPATRRCAAMSACFACDVDHHSECPSIGEEDFSIDADEHGWYTIYCCCGQAVDTAQTTAAEYAEYAEELRQRGWSQPTDPATPPGVSG